MIWEKITYYSAGPIITLNGRITASDCMNYLRNQMHPTCMLYPNNAAVLQDDSSHMHPARMAQP